MRYLSAPTRTYLRPPRPPASVATLAPARHILARAPTRVTVRACTRREDTHTPAEPSITGRPSWILANQNNSIHNSTRASEQCLVPPRPSEFSHPLVLRAPSRPPPPFSNATFRPPARPLRRRSRSPGSPLSQPLPALTRCLLTHLPTYLLLRLVLTATTTTSSLPTTPCPSSAPATLLYNLPLIHRLTPCVSTPDRATCDFSLLFGETQKSSKEIERITIARVCVCVCV